MKSLEQCQKELKELKECSTKIDGKSVIFYQYTTPHESEAKSSGVYDVNGSTLIFIDGGEVFVTDAGSNEAILRSNGFEQGFFSFAQSVMSRNTWKWIGLQELLTISKEKIEEWYDEHYIKNLPKSVLEKCFEIPDSGIMAKNILYEVEIHPISLHRFDSTKLGRYCCNNGKVVFVHRDGKTFVAKGYGIVNLLEDAGYRSGSLFVPFSNGETPTDPQLATRWEKLPKF